MNNRDRRWYQSRIRQLEERMVELKDQIVMFEQENGLMEQRIAELEASKKRVKDQLHAHDLSHEIAIKEKDKRIAELVTNCTEGLHVPAKMMPDGLVLCQNCAKELTDKDYNDYHGKN